MAHIVPTTDYNSFPNIVIVSWAGLKSTDTCEPFYAPHYNDKTYTLTGERGGTATVRLVGTNVRQADGTATDDANSWMDLRHSFGSNLGTISPTMGVILENTLFIKPILGNGSLTTDLQVVICARLGSR